MGITVSALQYVLICYALPYTAKGRILAIVGDMYRHFLDILGTENPDADLTEHRALLFSL